MAFTMHSHSGQFCPGHARDSLEEVIQRAMELGFQTIGLTEHMPRTALSDLYPEEVSTFIAKLYPIYPIHLLAEREREIERESS